MHGVRCGVLYPLPCAKKSLNRRQEVSLRQHPRRREESRRGWKGRKPLDKARDKYLGRVVELDTVAFEANMWACQSIAKQKPGQPRALLLELSLPSFLSDWKLEWQGRICNAVYAE